jgi:hypothetical protein
MIVAIAVVVLAVFGRGGAGAPQRPWLHPAAVALPPARGLDLGSAAAIAGCKVVATRGVQTDLALRRPELPPTFGPPVPVAARPGAYADAITPSSAIGALRAGLMIIHFRPTLPAPRLHQLRALADESPRQTILTPDGNATPFVVAVTGWRRLLGCSRLDDAFFDAARAFRARYAGHGPDRRR